jgi:hypothetical protein
MATWGEAVESRARHYAERFDRPIEKQLGFAYDGIVFSTTCQSAIKALRYQPLYERERDVYLRLEERGIEELAGCSVPKLVQYDDDLWIVEMEIVRPPFVLDFAGAYLDRPPDFPEEIMADWRAEKKEQFGERWPQVQDVMREFRKLGIYLADVKPGNIMFRD